jgi:hypothetical protein
MYWRFLRYNTNKLIKTDTSIKAVKSNDGKNNKISKRVEKTANELSEEKNIQNVSNKTTSTNKIGIMAKRRKIKMRNKGKLTSNTTQATLVKGKLA